MPGGRPKGIWTPEIVRERIQVTKLVDCLQKHALGKLKMGATQIQAAGILLKKVLPDQTEVLGEIKHNHVISDKPLTAAEFEQQLASGAYGNLGATAGSSEVPH